MASAKETKTAEPAYFMKGTNKLRKLLTLALLSLALTLIITTETTYAAKVKKLTVKTTGNMLIEGDKITTSTIKKVATVKATYTDGTTKTYTGYKVKEANKTVKAITSGTNKGKCKLTLTAGNVKKVIYVKVNKLKKIYIKKLKTFTLKENGTCNVNNFKKAYAVYGKYQKGADKRLSNFTVSAPKIVKPNASGNCIVTVIACGKKANVSIPVKKTTPTQPVDVDPPTEVDWLYFYEPKYSVSHIIPNAGVYIAVDLPEDYTSLEKFGCIYTTYNITDNSFIKGHRKTTGITSLYTDRTQKLSLPLNLNKDDWDSHATVKVRVYANVIKDNKQMTVYSKVLTFKLE